MTSLADTSTERVPVVISGAGPVGLSLALMLARGGVRALVLEKKTALDPHSRATLIVPRSLELFQRLRVLDAFLAQGERNDAIRLLRASDRHRLLTFDFSSLAARTPTPFALALSQDRTERILLTAVEATGLVEVAFSTPFDRFEHLADAVRVHASRRVIDAELLVGADGAHSGVRDQLGWKLEGKTYPTRAVLADVRIAATRDTRAGWLVDTDAEAFTLAIRFADGVWRLIESAVPDTVTDADLPARAERIAGRLFGAGAWQQTIWAAAYHKHERRVGRYVEKRVVLAGDAAHLNSPAGGQGMNAGLADADRLGDAIIQGFGRPAELPALLAGYERERTETFDHDIRGLTNALETMETVPAWARRLAFGAIGLARAFGVERAVANRLSMLGTPTRAHA
ncbi:MAG: FAD-dependent oxidoreductase [Methylovirgula sp.]